MKKLGIEPVIMSAGARLCMPAIPERAYIVFRTMQC